MKCNYLPIRKSRNNQHDKKNMIWVGKKNVLRAKKGKEILNASINMFSNGGKSKKCVGKK